MWILISAHRSGHFLAHEGPQSCVPTHVLTPSRTETLHKDARPLTPLARHPRAQLKRQDGRSQGKGSSKAAVQEPRGKKEGVEKVRKKSKEKMRNGESNRLTSAFPAGEGFALTP